MFNAVFSLGSAVLKVRRDIRMCGAPAGLVSERALIILTDKTRKLSEKARDLKTHLSTHGTDFIRQGNGFNFAHSLVLISRTLFPNEPFSQGRFLWSVINNCSPEAQSTIDKKELPLTLVRAFHKTADQAKLETSLFVAGLAKGRHHNKPQCQEATAKLIIEAALGEGQTALIENASSIIMNRQLEISACELAKRVALGLATLAPTIARQVAEKASTRADDLTSLANFTGEALSILPTGTQLLQATQAGITASKSFSMTVNNIVS